MGKIVDETIQSDPIIDQDGKANDDFQDFLEKIVIENDLNVDLAEGIESLSADGDVSVDLLITQLTTVGAQVNLTLADGIPGKSRKKIIMIARGGSNDAVITVPSLFGGNTLTSNAVGDYISLLFLDILGWYPEVNNGVTITTV